jgi:hypothetical protein
MKMNPLFRLFLAASTVALLSACASGPKYAEVRASIPPLAADQGRIYFYRSSNMMGSGIQPSVMLNGEKVGDSVPGGFFFVDRKPGNFEVLTSTEVERKLTFTLAAGQQQYVRFAVGMGVMVYRVYPELVDAETGGKEIQEATYIGAPLKK